jgi:hypothetical protein
MEQILLSEMQFDADLTSLRREEMWKRANHLDNLGRQLRTLNALG